MNNCKTCGARCEKEYCFKHKKRTPLSKGTKIPINNKMHDFFRSIWSKRPHKSEISNTPIYGEILTIYFHHILPKNKYPQLAFEEDNIVILTFQEHQKVENDKFYYPEINRRREYLKTKNNLI